MSNYGIVEYFGGNDSSYPCGYCKAMKAENTDNGMWSHRLSNINYQNLIDRNWRRSGKYCYKPFLQTSCCPMYTIRCDSLNFKLRKSQKKVIKKLNRFIISGEKSKKRSERHVMNTITDVLQMDPILDESIANEEYKMSVDSQPMTIETNVMNVLSYDERSEDKLKPNVQKKTKAKTLRIERKLNKIMEKQKCDQKIAKNIMNENFKKKINKNKIKSIEDYLNEIENYSKNSHKLKVRFVSTTTDEYKETFEASHEVYRRYQMSIHNDSIDKCTAKQFKRFLIDSPLENEYFEASDDLPNHFGSFHQQYWLDDKLIAVGVIDVLPFCVSSVYLYYDPEYEFLSLGTYSALREISLVRRLQQFIPDLKYYYMGFYIHSCPKMKYKGNYMPSDLLCGETFSWHSITKCIPKLDFSKYSRFEDNLNAIDCDSNAIKDTEIKILFNRTDISFLQYKSIRVVNHKEEEEIKEYAKLIGRKCLNKILLYRS